MIIVSQDKAKLINFNNIKEIRKIHEDYNDVEIEVLINDGYIVLGRYKTEERAKEVLAEFTYYKAMFEYYRCSPNDVKQDIARDFIKDDVMFDTYEMPED